MKCDSCIHKQVCKDKPPESYPQFMINIMTDKCENYIHNAYVQPVQHGHWIAEENWTPDDYYYTCSICREDFYMIVGTPSDNNYKYCPNCGAKMDGGDIYD